MKESRLWPLFGVVAITICVVHGCVIDNDPGGHFPAPGTTERAVRESQAAHLEHVADVYHKMAQTLEGDKVFDIDDFERQIEADSKVTEFQDFAELDRLKRACAERGKVGMRQVKLVWAFERGYRQAAETLRGQK
jgi:hypothetical protein